MYASARGRSRQGRRSRRRSQKWVPVPPAATRARQARSGGSSRREPVASVTPRSRSAPSSDSMQPVSRASASSDAWSEAPRRPAPNLVRSSASSAPPRANPGQRRSACSAAMRIVPSRLGMSTDRPATSIGSRSRHNASNTTPAGSRNPGNRSCRSRSHGHPSRIRVIECSDQSSVPAIGGRSRHPATRSRSTTSENPAGSISRSASADTCGPGTS